jgi:predicted HTH domain antitoxin
MQITVELPPDIARHPQAGREALEALVIAGYRSRQLTQREAGQMLGLSRIETEDFLGQHVVLYDYSIEDLEAEADLLDRLHRPH